MDEKDEIALLLEEYKKNEIILANARIEKFHNVLNTKLNKCYNERKDKVETSAYLYGVDLKDEEDYRTEDVRKIYKNYIESYKRNISGTTGVCVACHMLGNIEKVNLHSQKVEKIKAQMVYNDLKNEIVEKNIINKEDNKEKISNFDLKISTIREKIKDAEKKGDTDQLSILKKEYENLEKEGRDFFGSECNKYMEVHCRLEDTKEEKQNIQKSIENIDNVVSNIENKAHEDLDKASENIPEAEIECEIEGTHKKITAGEFLKKFGKQAAINTGKSIIAGLLVGVLGPTALESYFLEAFVKKLIKCDDDYVTSVMDDFIEEERKAMQNNPHYIRDEEAFIEGASECSKNQLKSELDKNDYEENKLEAVQPKAIIEDEAYDITINTERASRFGSKKAGMLSSRLSEYCKGYEEYRLDDKLEKEVR